MLGQQELKDKLRTKERLDERTIALRAAKDIKNGQYINLGYGMPNLIGLALPFPDKAVFLQVEIGLLGYGPVATQEEGDAVGWIYVDANGAPVHTSPGMSVFSVAESFEMIRAKKLDACILGAFQVSEKGDIANWSSPRVRSSIGGAMDLALGAKDVWVCMTHVTADNEFKIVKECSYPLTAKECVTKIFTDLAVIKVTKKGLLLEEVAPGWTAEEVQALTEPRLTVGEGLKEIEL